MDHSAPETDNFPNDPIFARLAQLARDISGIRIYDEHGVEAGYGDLISDVVHLRTLLCQHLPSQWFDDRGILISVRSIGTLTSSGYYFLVAFFAIFSIGGSCAPLSIGLFRHNNLHNLQKCNATYLLAEPLTADSACSLEENARSSLSLNVILMRRCPRSSAPYLHRQFVIDENMIISPESTCLIIFTSGTTDKPKGAAIPRRRFYVDLPPDYESVYLACRPIQWIGGASRAILQILRGGKIHFTKHAPASATEIWENIKEDNITQLCLSSQGFREMQDHYINVIENLSTMEHKSYLDGVSKLRHIECGGSPLEASTAAFWERLTGIPIRVVYAATELGGTVMTSEPGAPYLHRGIGSRPLPGVVIKLSNGDSGEILVKGPGILTHYVGDAALTRAAFDQDGFYKTGDTGRLEGGQYFFEGRANADYIRFRCFTISVLELEERLLELPYISEAHILPVLDYEAKGLAAALIRLHTSSDEISSEAKQEQKSEINLQKLRGDLVPTMGKHKLPALLRILKVHERVPRTVSQKVMKTEALERFFGIVGYRPPNYRVEGVEFWGNELG